MIGWLTAHWWEVAILAFVAGLEFFYFGRCWRLARIDDVRSELARLRNGVVEPDIIARAKRGQDPDWLHYTDAADRKVEHRSDSFRVYATTALATGIGGTIFALSLHLLLGEWDTTDPVAPRHAAMEYLLRNMGLALVASALGVVNNLLILLWLLPRADQQFREMLDGFQNSLRNIGERHPPTETLAEAVRSKLGEAFRDAVARFPEAFAQLDRSVEALGKVIESQTGAILAAQRGLENSARSLAAAGEVIEPAANSMSASVTKLNSLPEALAATLRDTQDSWTGQIREDQQRFLDGVKEVLGEQKSQAAELAESLRGWEDARAEAEAKRQQEHEDATRRIVNSLSDVTGAVSGIPAELANAVNESADTFGERFGTEARNHVADLIQDGKQRDTALRQHLQEQAETLRADFLNNTSDVVRDTLRRFYEDLDKALFAKLAEIGDGLREAMHELPEEAKGFAASLATVDRKMQRVVVRIDESADHLGRVANVTKEFNGDLTDALRQVTDRHIARLDPVFDNLQKAHADINKLVAEQVAFIEDLLAHVERA